MAGLIRRFWHEVYAALQAYGAIYMSGAWLPPAAAPPATAPHGGAPSGAAARELAGPPRDHPERLCPEVALTPVERALNRQLEGGEGGF